MSLGIPNLPFAPPLLLVLAGILPPAYGAPHSPLRREPPPRMVSEPGEATPPAAQDTGIADTSRLERPSGHPDGVGRDGSMRTRSAPGPSVDPPQARTESISRGTLPSRQDPGPGKDPRPLGRAGVLFGGLGVAIEVGGMVRTGVLALGADAWIRPWAWSRTIRTSPGRRIRVQELLFGGSPWIQLEVPLGFLRASEDGLGWRIAPLASVELASGYWYGTSRQPAGDASPALGLRILHPAGGQASLRYTFGSELVGSWRGDLAWEF